MIELLILNLIYTNSLVSGCAMNEGNKVKLSSTLNFRIVKDYIHIITILERLIEVAKIELNIPNLFRTCLVRGFLSGAPANKNALSSYKEKLGQ